MQLKNMIVKETTGKQPSLVEFAASIFLKLILQMMQIDGLNSM
jgi:hypothetical protein